MRSSTLLAILAIALLSLSGCNERQIAQAEAGVAAARQTLSDVEGAIATAKAALAQAKAAAELLGTKVADDVIAKANAAVAMAEKARPVAEATMKVAETTLAAAKQSQANGDSTGGTLLTIISTLVAAIPTVGIPLAMALNNAKKQRDEEIAERKRAEAEAEARRKAISIVAAYADKMELAETPEQVKAAKDSVQAAAGLHNVADVIAGARGKTVA